MYKRFISGILIIAVFGLLSVSMAEAGFKKLGLAGFSFLKITQAARPAAMADAYTAVVDDVNALYSNPAGLPRIRAREFTFSYNSWIANTKIYAVGLGWKLGTHAVGLHVLSFQPESIVLTTPEKPDGSLGRVSIGSVVVAGTYAIQFTDKFSFGVQGKFVQEDLHLDKNRTFDVDLGMLFYTGFRSSRIAMSLKNLGPDETVNTESFFSPIVFNVAAAMEVYGKVEDPVYLTVAAENVFAIDYEQRFHAGGELWLANTLALRAGYKFNYDVETFSVGVGLKKAFGDRKIAVDFAYTDFGELLDAPIRLTVTGSF